jgi:hypothetical protein
MSDRDCSAVHIQLVIWNAQFVTAVNNLHGKRLIQFPKIDVIHRQAVALQ